MDSLDWSSRSGETGRPHEKKVRHATLRIHNKCLNSTMKLPKAAKFAHKQWANFGTLWRTLKILWPKKNVKNWQEKQEKVGKITYIDFTARLKSCSTKTKFDNLFKTNRKVAQDSWARFATFWGILSFKLKKLYANYHALSKVFVEWLPTTAVVIF